MPGGSKRSKKTACFIDYEFLIIIVFLVCFGLMMLYSATAYNMSAGEAGGISFFEKQAVFAAIGFAAMYFISKIDYHFFGRIAGFIYLASLFAMFLVKTPLGYESHGARRWLQLLPGGRLTLQPSEIGKVGIIIITAYLICRMAKRLDTAKGFALILALAVFTCVWVKIFTENLSTALITAAIPLGMLFVAHPRYKPFGKLLLVVAALAAAVLIYAKNVPSQEEGRSGTDSYQLGRIISWIKGSEDEDQDGSYQVKQGMYAIGSGGFWGKGLGKSTQKLGPIPEVQNDMILPVICEELGIFGAIVVMALFACLIFRLMFIAQNAPDEFGSLLVTGVLIHIALQVVLNVAVVTNMMPTTGITLPFFSSGGTSIILLMSEMGIALGVSKKIVLE